jgi:hypothetical protein
VRIERHNRRIFYLFLLLAMTKSLNSRTNSGAPSVLKDSVHDLAIAMASSGWLISSLSSTIVLSVRLRLPYYDLRSR